MEKYTEPTPMLDYAHGSIRQLVCDRQWTGMDETQKIREIYDFVRNDIAFGYNTGDDLPASAVLADGYGQCNTKGTLLMALLRASGVPCRIHGFTIDKKLQRGAMTGLIYLLAPRSIIHSWVEVWYLGQWRNLEGFILDSRYLGNLQAMFPDCNAGFCGYGAATDNFRAPQVEWDGQDTYIQKEGINHDFGVFDTPDAFFSQHPQQLSPVKKWVFQHVGRRLMNRNVNNIRNR